MSSTATTPARTFRISPTCCYIASTFPQQDVEKREIYDGWILGVVVQRISPIT